MTTKSKPRHPRNKTPLQKALDNYIVFKSNGAYYVTSPLKSKQHLLGLVGEENEINNYIRMNPAGWRK